MLGVALRCTGNFRRAAESYQAAGDICEEYDDMPNWAVAQANLGKTPQTFMIPRLQFCVCTPVVFLFREGLLCLKAGAQGLAIRHLNKAVELFSELSEGGHEANFIAVLLELGQLYVKHRQLDHGKGCYEWALLLAISANLLECKCVSHTVAYI